MVATIPITEMVMSTSTNEKAPKIDFLFIPKKV